MWKYNAASGLDIQGESNMQTMYKLCFFSFVSTARSIQANATI